MASVADSYNRDGTHAPSLLFYPHIRGQNLPASVKKTFCPPSTEMMIILVLRKTVCIDMHNDTCSLDPQIVTEVVWDEQRRTNVPW